MPRQESFTIKISEAQKQDKHSIARQKIMEDFGKLLDKYAQDINASGQKPPQGLTIGDVGTKITVADPHRLN